MWASALALTNNESMQPLKAKSALITGGARRIGREIALQFAAAGADVAITFLTSKKEAQKTVVDIGGYGVRALSLQCDVRDEKSIQVALKEVVREFGGIDVLVNNAALYETAEIEKITLVQWDNIFAINTRGSFLFSRVCAPQLRKRQGKIINIGSLGGLRPWTSHAHYCQSKAALHLQTQILAKAFAPEIAVNCVAPGMIDLQGKKRSEFLKKIAGKTPMQRNGNAAEVAAAVLLLAQMPQFVTGQILVVDGGLSLT